MKEVKIIFLFVLSFGNAYRVPGLHGSSQSVPIQLIKDVVGNELTHCAMFCLYDFDIPGPIVEVLMSMDSPGVVAVNLDTLGRHGDLQQIKDTILSSKSPTCVSYIILVTEAWKYELEPPQVFSRQDNVLIINNKPRPETRHNILEHSVFRDILRLVVAEPSRSGTSWNLYSMNRHFGLSPGATVSRVSWYSETGIKGGIQLFKSNNMNDFHEHEFVIATLDYSLFVRKRSKRSHQTIYSGLEVDILKLIARGANFRFRFIEPAERSWGSQTQDGSWTGLIGLVSNRTANWAVGFITDTPERNKVVDFSPTILFDAIELVTPNAQPLPLWLGPIRPFQGTVWFCVLVSVFVATSIINVISKYTKEDIHFYSFLYCLEYCLCPLFHISNHQKYRNPSGRVFLVFWSFKAMLLSIFYSTALTAFLVLPGLTTPIKTIEELVESDLNWGMVNYGGYHMNFLRTATDPALSKLGQKSEFNRSLDELLNDVTKGIYATWDSSIVLQLKAATDYTDSSGKFKFYFTRQYVTNDRISWPFPKNSIYKNRIDVLLRRFMERGIIDKMSQIAIYEETQMLKQSKAKVMEHISSSTEVVLRTGHFEGPFYVLLFGLMMGIVILLAELIVSRKHPILKKLALISHDIQYY